ncbi:hypothetical protein HDU97_004177 [Phlyctochytrium planicorne]|nr:hypothetical protein HDU97_004177 [Phlyctochytrium planicorne]
MSAMLAIKVVGPGPERVTRRFSINPSEKSSWESIERQIKTLHGINTPIIVTYLDEDNEEIRIDSDVELADLIASAQRQNLSSIRFSVSLKDAMGNASDPRESINSVATYRTQASQNLSSIIPPPPSPKSFDREGWQVLDDGTPVGSSGAHASSSSLSYGRFGNQFSSSSDDRPVSQPLDMYRDSASGSEAYNSQPRYDISITYPSLSPFDDSHALESVPPLFPTPTPTSAPDYKARAEVEAKIFAVIAENEAKLKDEENNEKAAPEPSASTSSSAPAPGSTGGGLPEDVRKFIDQVRSVVSSYPEALKQLNVIVDQQIAKNVNVSLEYAIHQIQASIAKVHQTGIDVLNSESAEKFSKTAREAAYRARIEAYDASRRAYEEARSAAKMAKEAFRQARRGPNAAASTSSSSSSIPTPASTPASEKGTPPSYLSRSSADYEEAAKAARDSGYGIGLPSYGASERDPARYEKQKAKLRDMGFTDEGLNADLLEQNDGQVEKVVEMLMQLQM